MDTIIDIAFGPWEKPDEASLFRRSVLRAEFHGKALVRFIVNWQKMDKDDQAIGNLASHEPAGGNQVRYSNASYFTVAKAGAKRTTQQYVNALAEFHRRCYDIAMRGPCSLDELEYFHGKED